MNAGLKVAICEQIENGVQCEARVKEEMKGKSAEERKSIVKAIKREVAQIFTKGTHFKLTDDPTALLGEYETKHVLSFYNRGTKFGYCYFDMSTLKFYLGSFQDDFTLKQFRTLVMQTRPVEFVCTSGTGDHTNIKGQETLKILRNSPCPPASTLISYKDASDQVEPILNRFYDKNDPSTWPDPIREALACSESKIALGLCLVFLDKLLLADTSIPVACFEWQVAGSGTSLAST